MGIIIVVAPALLPPSSWRVCAVALVLLPLSQWCCCPCYAGIRSLVVQASLPLLCFHSAVDSQASLPLLSWHKLSCGQRGRPRRRQRQHQHNKGNNASTTRAASTMRVMMPEQRGQQCQHDWQRQHDESWRQRDKGNNVDEVVHAAVECGYNYLRLLQYADWQHINVLKHFLMFNMDAGSSLRGLSELTLT